LTGLLKRAIRDKVDAVLLCLETGGVRLHEANAGLIAVSEVMRAVLDVREAGIPVIVIIGGSNGCYGGMGIVACCANSILMSEESRLGMSGPEVIETAFGVEEFDSRDRALVWRIMGGKHRYLLGDCQRLIVDNFSAFRTAASEAIREAKHEGTQLTLEKLEKEQLLLEQRVQQFGLETDSLEIWKKIGFSHPEEVPLLEIEKFIKLVDNSKCPGGC